MANNEINIQYFPSPDSAGISLSRTNYSYFEYPRHFHDHYTIQLTEAGVNEGFTEKLSYKTGPGDILMINPADLHAGKSLHKSALAFWTIRIEPWWLQEFCNQNELPSDPNFTTRPISDLDLVQSIKRSMIMLMQHQVIEFEEHLQEWLACLISRHAQSTCNIKPDYQPNRVEIGHQFLQDNYHQNLSLKQIADAASLSPYHFLRQFKKTYGLSPLQYLRNVRVEKAKKMLHETNLTQVAQQVGFYDQSHLTRNFKRIEGTAPSLTRS